eukprot:PhM_4_TR13536/c1_g1_i1/m.78796/K00559/E2.1.1.41, SMT1, ERG6; sterol 24-C-methyltransferase
MIQQEALPTKLFRSRAAGEENGDIDKTTDRFCARFDGDKASLEVRQAESMSMVNEYYDLVTDFYEYGWGQAFHFAPRYADERFHESLCRHEYFLASRGGFREGMRVLDLGCGVGGPMRNIARFCGANVIGINNNEYQIQRGTRHNARAGVSHLCSFIKTSFMDMKAIKDGEYDGAYAIEATCHAPNKTACFAEAFRCLKPGATFVGYEWIMTKKYDPANERHRSIKHGIELGDALPDLETAEMVVKALKDAGFIVEEAYDVIEKYDASPAKTIPWYYPLSGSLSIEGFKSTTLGRMCTNTMVRCLEFLRLAPKGSVKTTQILEAAASNLVLGGELGIFTPCFYFKARKPAN